MIWEIPAVKLEEGESPELTAMRELEEETGLRATKVLPFGLLYPTPGYTDEKIYLYEAVGVKCGATHLDDGELLEKREVPALEALEMLGRGEIRDAKTVIALYYLKNSI